MDGNWFNEDPQYGVFPATLDTDDTLTDLGRVFIGILGDAGDLIRAPPVDCLNGRTVASVVYSEGDLLGDGAQSSVETLREEAAACELRYLILAPGADSFCNTRDINMSTAGPSVRRDYDVSVRRLRVQIVNGLPDWRVLALTPGSSTWLSQFTPAASSSSRWTSWETDLAPYGGQPG